MAGLHSVRRSASILSRGASLAKRQAAGMSLSMAFALARFLRRGRRLQTATHFLQILSVRPLHYVMVPAWGRFLRMAGYRQARVRWLEWAVREFDRPSDMFRLIDAKDHVGEETIDEISAMLSPVGAFKLKRQQADAFRKLKLLHGVNDHLETSGRARRFLGPDEFFEKRFLRKLWAAHNSGDQPNVRKYAQAVAETVNGDPATLFHVVKVMLIPNGHLDIASKLLDMATVSAARHPQVSALRFELAAHPLQPQDSGVEAGGVTMDQDSHPQDPTNVDAYYWAARVERMKGNPSFFKLILRYIESAVPKDALYLEDALYMAACHSEEIGDFAAADLYFQRMLLAGGIPYHLPDTVWRYASFLMGLGRWDEAALLLVEGQKTLWASYAALAKRSFQQRIANRTLIPDTGMLILGCQGISDDMIRLGVLYGSVADLSKFGMTCDPRMLPILRRSMPTMEFIAPSRLHGSHKVDIQTYWRDREGVPENIDTVRVSREVMDAADRFADIGISEDLLLSFVLSKGQLPLRPSEPMFKVDPVLVDEARAWMDTLPGKLKVAISWRSGVRDRIRNESYVDVQDLGPILRLKNIDFISLQYSDTREEEAEILQAFGCRLHKMPGVDLKDDIDKLAAVSKAADFVISPGTAARELAGAVGAQTFSLTTTPMLPDLWRVEEDGETDKIFPSIKHITIHRYRSKLAVVEEIARRLAEARDLNLS